VRIPLSKAHDEARKSPEERMKKFKGFTPTFWVANVLELFERLAYYGSKAILAVFVADQIGLGPEKAGWLVGQLLQHAALLPAVLAGPVVDRYGFKKSLLACFAIFSVGYFLIGLGGMPAGKPLVDALGAEAYMIVALLITAIGGSLIKPSIVGTVARTTTLETKGLGYSIYYTLVNLGGAIGPILALQVRESVGIAYVLVMSSLTSLALVVATLVFFREPERPVDARRRNRCPACWPTCCSFSAMPSSCRSWSSSPASGRCSGRSSTRCRSTCATCCTSRSSRSSRRSTPGRSSW
jgi:dipeptide/tripeptide permease